MEKILVKCTGFIGDTLFASSIAKKLKEQDPFRVVDFTIPVAQPLELLNNNPFFLLCVVVALISSSADCF